MPLPTPTIELIRAAGKEFDRENATTERGTGYLIENFPDNSHPPGVLLKAAAINQLYRTNIFAIEKVADDISSLPIDPLLKAGDQEAVCRIADFRLGKASVILSFATKYCNWHNFRAYPIFDRFADPCLWKYKQPGRVCRIELQRPRHWTSRGPLHEIPPNPHGLS